MTSFTSRPARAVPILLAALALTLAATAPAHAAEKRVAGTVTGPDGTPLAGVDVDLLLQDGEDGSLVASTRTDARGHYSFAQVSTSRTPYSLELDDRSGWHQRTYVPQFVVRGAVTKDATMKDAGILQGEVHSKDGDAPARPATAVIVTADRSDLTSFGDVRVAENGHFRLGGLAPGTYTVRFQDTSAEFEWLCYDDVPWSGEECSRPSAPVTVRAARATTLAPQLLDHRLGVVTGTVADVGGTGIARANVVAYGRDAGDQVAVTQTRSDGSFVLHGVEAGKIRLQATSSDGRHLARWYRDAKTFATATVLRMRDGGEIGDVVITLPSRP